MRFLVIAMACLCGGPAFGIGAAFPPSATFILWNVPLSEQTTNYSCGAAAMQSVLGYYGHDYTEAALIKELGTDAAKGTDHHRMTELATKLGLRAELRTGLQPSDLAAAINRGQPAIVEAQAWLDAAQQGKPWADLWDSGHYMVVIGIDDKNVYFADPSAGRKHGFIPLEEFVQRWHDLDWNNKKLTHTAILFDGEPRPAAQWVKVP